MRVMMNTPRQFLGDGELQISGDGEGWRAIDDRREFRASIQLRSTATFHRVGRGIEESVPYQPRVAPLVHVSVTEWDADAGMKYAVEVRPYEYSPDAADRFVIALQVWGDGKLNAAKVSWLAVAMHDPAIGG